MQWEIPFWWKYLWIFIIYWHQYVVNLICLLLDEINLYIRVQELKTTNYKRISLTYRNFKTLLSENDSTPIGTINKVWITFKFRRPAD